MRWARLCPAEKRKASRRASPFPRRKEKPTSGRAKAKRVNHSWAFLLSVLGVFKNFKRAGILENKSHTSTMVPRVKEVLAC